MQTDKDPELWKVAQKRASFKSHVLIYFIVNLFLWTMWYIQLKNNPAPGESLRIPWPLWATVGWGIGLLFNYIGAYKNTNSMAEKEYEKLTRNNNK